ncbi:MAG: hypothetical protein Q4C46_09350 [Bacillota bacterium]|nr:hypothetical protein [Bacillota bacterium]
MKNNTRGFYSLEASIFLPFVILAVLSLGYFMKVDGTWENCIHGAVDESGKAAARSYPSGTAIISSSTVRDRLLDDNDCLDNVKISNIRTGYSDRYSDKLTSFRISAEIKMKLPLGFGRQFTFESGIKFRGFTGKKQTIDPLGADGLETQTDGEPVWVFPHSGEKYHSEDCTYVKAAVVQKRLNSTIRRQYKSCQLCNSENIPSGSIVFCFNGENTAYHRGTCPTINRHTVIMDKNEAVKRNYVACSKCGGGQ